MTVLYSAQTKGESTNGPAGMRFQARDQIILQTVNEYGGVLAKRHLQKMFWPDKTRRAMERRLAKLFRNGYLTWPSTDQWRRHPIPEPICWLGWKGALRLASEHKVPVASFPDGNENQQRRLERAMRTAGLHWTREPRWIQLEHDLAVVDFRLLLEASLHHHPMLSLSEWLNESAFRSEPDVVEFDAVARNDSMKRVKRAVIPDGFFIIDDERRRRAGEPHRARFLLELDRATHDNPSFGLEKALPGAAYIRSQAYKRRFGHNSGRWLVVTTAGERRMQNLMRQTQARLSQQADLFSFTTFETLRAGNLLTSDLWFRTSSESPSPLIADLA